MFKTWTYVIMDGEEKYGWPINNFKFQQNFLFVTVLYKRPFVFLRGVLPVLDA